MADTKLHHALPVSGQKHNEYCGPAALAALTGLSTGAAAALLRQVSGARAIRGTPVRSMIGALRREGFILVRTEEWYPCKPITLRRWLDTEYSGGTCLVDAGHHWWAIDNFYFVDSFNRLPTSTNNIHNPKSQVRSIYYLDSY